MNEHEPRPEPEPRDDREEATSHDNVRDPRCDLCGARMKEWHCRIICTSCGYQRDCSDP